MIALQRVSSQELQSKPPPLAHTPESSCEEHVEVTLSADEEGHLIQECHPIPVVGRFTTNPSSDSDLCDVLMPQKATPGCSDKLVTHP